MAVARTLFNGVGASNNSAASNSSSSSGRNSVAARVQCCAAAASRNAVAERILQSPTTISLPQLLQAPEDDDKECDVVTFINYDELPSTRSKSSSWLTPQYLDFRLRCNSLMMNEARDALSRHFKGRTPSVSVKPSSLQFDHRRQQHLETRYVRPISTVDLIKECILADTQHEYFKDSITLPTPTLEEAFC